MLSEKSRRGRRKAVPGSASHNPGLAPTAVLSCPLLWVLQKWRERETVEISGTNWSVGSLQPSRGKHPPRQHSLHDQGGWREMRRRKGEEDSRYCSPGYPAPES
ncbi:uncharacterized protein LOC123508186 [Portunus trituberculatus]|uniref:uncharacterized protein LOC123508186 n=1 Tax=Portunus trituberculatus TaxID=210409 RepID=UPI001E1CF41D|nr:uncharacterized protein LOC123508186 [Portunus trituberculatus]